MLKISIITPSFNQGQFIEETIISVLDQRYPNFEHIVIDGGSNDETIAILKKYPHLKWISEADNGQSEAINKGFKMATGDIIAWLNSDDVYLPNVFSKINHYFNENQKCIWLCGNVLFADSTLKITSRKKPFYSPFLLHFASASVYQPNVFLRKEVLKKIGYLKDDFHAIMDREWFSRISKLYEPDLIDCDFVIFRWHETNKSVSSKSSNHYNRYIKESAIVAGNYNNSTSLKFFLRHMPKVTLSFLGNIARILKVFTRGKRAFKPLNTIPN